MENNGRVVKELVNFVREQRKINLDQKRINQDQKRINQDQKKINHRLELFVKEQRKTNQRCERRMETMENFMIQSEKRFRLFYQLITNLQR